jgi:putative adenylate-forming enzyme
MTIHNTIRLSLAYARALRLDRLQQRSRLVSAQQRWLEDLQRFVTRHSSYYAPFRGVPWDDWPILTKSSWMDNFDALNTVGARHVDVAAIALEAERTRDFSQRWGPFTVGLSTGTSGSRGIFMVSPVERATWAGTLLGKLLRSDLLGRERIALVLRAGATLYETVGVLRLQFRYFDQSRPWDSIIRGLEAYDPTILVAPASVLHLLTASRALRPRRVISVAEVLDPLNRSRIEGRFGVTVGQIYQATEGLLGVSCEVGTVHLNEPYILVEPEWQDRERTRFVPIVTDLWRRSQPVIRYRLDDVLQVAPKRCPCGRASLALASIDGRTDDILWLDSPAERVPIFPDVLSRVIVQAVLDLDDYEVEELASGKWRIGLSPAPTGAAQNSLQNACTALALRLGAQPPSVMLTPFVRTLGASKQRRIRGHGGACAS